MFGGSLHRIDYAYDPLDNLRAVTHAGVREHSYWYNGKNQLTNVLNTAGASVVGLDYDPQGNLRQKNGQTYGFDYGNRLRWVMGKENYRYDALGRRVETMRDDGTLRLFQYSQAGQYMFGWKKTPAGAETTQENVYLGGSLVATIDHNWPSNTVIATKYQHTDALGSPVAVTNTSGAVIERTNYEPYGSPINKTVDGIGYTGHVMDGATGLTYMQQRYYDPTLGRFLSVDPVAASNMGANFSRYWYAGNNPYRFIDPDGRQALDQSAKYLDLNRRHNGNTASMSSEMSSGFGIGLAATVAAMPSGMLLRGLALSAARSPGSAGNILVDLTMGDALGGASLAAGGATVAGAAYVTDKVGDAVQSYGPFHRLGDSAESIKGILISGELRGNPPTHIFRSDIPKVQAYEGPLPEGYKGFEFLTPVAPDAGHVPGKPTWSPHSPGIVERSGQAVIPCTVTKSSCN